MKPLGNPAAETSSHLRLHTIAQSDNHVKVVALHLPFNLARTFYLNCSEFPNSCLPYQLSIFKNMINMLTYIKFACSLTSTMAIFGSVEI